MADGDRQVARTGEEHPMMERSMVGASVAGVAVGAPLLGMMGFTFLATGTLLLISFPLLVIFSPLLLFAVFVFVVALTGFGVATLMAVGGVSMLATTVRRVGLHTRVLRWLTESSQRVEEEGKDWVGHLQQRSTDDRERKNTTAPEENKGSMTDGDRPSEQHHVTGRSMVGASVAGMAVGAPLLGTMGFTFLATGTLLLISFPLLVIFSPPLLFAASVFASALAGFGAAALVAVAGVSMLACTMRQVGVHIGVGGRLTESSERVQEEG